MSIQAVINQAVEQFIPGQVFGYAEMPLYQQSPNTVVKAISRLVASQQLSKLSKGRFYRPKVGVLGELKPSDNELLKTVLFHRSERIGYITGPSLFNRLGLITQIPKTIVVATVRAPQIKDFGTIKVKLVKARAPLIEDNVSLLELLDVLKYFRRVPDSTPTDVLKKIELSLLELKFPMVSQLLMLAINYYPASVRALLGLLLSKHYSAELNELRATLNPTTRYHFKLDQVLWPHQKDWYIQ